MLRRVLVLTDGTPDAEFRATGLLDALNLQLSVELQVLTLSIKELKWWLACLPYTGLYYLKKLFSKFTFGNEEAIETVRSFDEGSVLVVSCGHSAVPTAVELRMAFQEKVFTVHLGNPCCHPKFFDVVIAATYEIGNWALAANPGNVVVTEGIVNRATYRLLRHSKDHCWKQFSQISHPTMVLHMGRPTWECFYDVDAVFDLVRETCEAALSKKLVSSVVVVLSAITPERLVKKIKALDWMKQWTGDFLCALSWADFVVITADSLRACSEVTSAGKPLMILGEDSCQGALLQFFTLLGAKGIVKPFSFDTLEKFPEGWRYPPLNCSVQAANEVADRIARRTKLSSKWYRS